MDTSFADGQWLGLVGSFSLITPLVSIQRFGERLRATSFGLYQGIRYYDYVLETNFVKGACMNKLLKSG